MPQLSGNQSNQAIGMLEAGNGRCTAFLAALGKQVIVLVHCSVILDPFMIVRDHVTSCDVIKG
jgi:hypothetical protein